MNSQEAANQIQQMVEFIRQEAKEKEEEIHVKTEEEFDFQKLNLVTAAKAKLRDEFKKKEDALDVKNRIARSKKFNEARMEKMKVRDEIVMKCKNLASQKLGEVGTHARYAELLTALLVQGLLRLMEPNVVVQCREQDVNIVKSIIPKSISTYIETLKSQANKTVSTEITISSTHLPPGPGGKNTGVSCYGGIVLLGLDNRIAVDNTLDSRLDLAFEQLKPQVRELLFGKRPKAEKKAVEPKAHH